MAVQAVKNVPVQVHYYGKRDSTVTVEVVLQLELPLKAASAAASSSTTYILHRSTVYNLSFSLFIFCLCHRVVRLCTLKIGKHMYVT